MNDTELESLLRSMTPTAPSAGLAGRVQHDLDLMKSFREAKPEEVLVSRQKPARWLSNLVWAGLGAAAAVAVMGAVQVHGRSGTGIAAVKAQPAATSASVAISAASIMPVSSTREWVDVEDMGISFATPDSPARQMKVISMERHQWIDPRDGAEYTVEVPKEESVVLPMKYQ